MLKLVLRFCSAPASTYEPSIVFFAPHGSTSSRTDEESRAGLGENFGNQARIARR